MNRAFLNISKRNIELGIPLQWSFYITIVCGSTVDTILDNAKLFSKLQSFVNIIA